MFSRRRGFIATCISLSFVLGVSAQAQVSQSFGLSAEQLDPNSFQIDVVPYGSTEKAILVRTQPSATLLVAIMDRGFRSTAEGQALYDDIMAEGVEAYIETTLPIAIPRAIVAPPPAGDDRISVHVWGTFEGQELIDFPLADVQSAAPLQSLSFSSKVLNAAGDVKTCCECGSPPKDCGCKTCPGGRTSCNCVACEASCY